MGIHHKTLHLLWVGCPSTGISRLEHEIQLGGWNASIEPVDDEGKLDIALAGVSGPASDGALLYTPGTSALSLAAALNILRQSETDLPLILVGQDIAPEFVAEAMRAGAADCLSFANLSRLRSIIEREKHDGETQKPEMNLKGQRAPGKFVNREERYSTAGTAFNLISELDSEGRYLYCTPAYSLALGYAPDELLGCSVFDRIHPEDSERFRREFTTAREGRRPGEVAYRFKSKPGEYRWFESAFYSIEADASRRVVQVSHDTTARKKDEDEFAFLVMLVKAINAQNQLSGIARELRIGLRGVLPFDSLLIAFCDELRGEATDELQLAQSNENGETTWRMSPVGNGDHPICKALDRDEVCLDNDWDGGPFGINIPARACLSAPLRIDDEIRGLLHFDSARPGVFTEDHARLAGIIAGQVAVAARQTQLLAQAQGARGRFRNLVDHINAIVWEADAADVRFTYISPQVEEWLGYAPERLMYDRDLWSSLIHPDDRERVFAETVRAVAAAEDHQIDYRVMAADGHFLWLRQIVNVEKRADASDGHDTVKLLGVSIDITERKEAEEAIHESNAILRATQEAVADAICLVDESGAVVSFNSRFREMWRIPAKLIEEERDRRQLMECVLDALEQPDEFVNKMEFLLEHPESSSRDEIRLKDGRLFERYSAPAVSPDGRAFGRVWTFSDISERKNYEQQLAHQAFHDPLTDLPNRTLFVDRIKHALAHLDRAYPAIAVLFLDLDRFKIINDSLGHAVGDWLLTEVAHRLQRCMRPGDTAARFGGDEFTLLLENIGGADDAVLVAERVLDSLNSPFVNDGQELYITSSIGIAVGTSPEERADDLLRNADVAMYRAKNKGKARYEIFDMEVNAQALDRLQLEIELRQAVKRQQLHLDYQPLVDLDNDRIVGVEALVRWHHPQRGLVSPGDFIPIAEESGMIVEIGRWVLREACGQAHRWHQEIPIDPPLRMSVNISTKQFHQSDIVEEVASVLKESGLDAGSLELEVSEGALMENAEEALQEFEALKRLGVKLSVDAFGAGYSSLSLMERLPLDVLKIDRSFVSQLGERSGFDGTPDHSRDHGEDGATDRAVVMQALSTLGQGLGVRITAGGIETLEQLTHLRELGCDIGQGFLFARPLTGEDLEQVLRDKFIQNNHAGDNDDNQDGVGG